MKEPKVFFGSSSSVPRGEVYVISKDAEDGLNDVFAKFGDSSAELLFAPVIARAVAEGNDIDTVIVINSDQPVIWPDGRGSEEDDD